VATIILRAFILNVLLVVINMAFINTLNVPLGANTTVLPNSPKRLLWLSGSNTPLEA